MKLQLGLCTLGSLGGKKFFVSPSRKQNLSSDAILDPLFFFFG